MPDDVTLKIDDQEVTVPAGTLVVDAAKRLGVDIPVFCYHPKLDPVGMCRMCLVEIGTPMRDRQSGEFVLENGAPKIGWRPGLVTACTERVSPGMQVRTATDRVTRGRRDILEFLLTSHPLDCPICDKGGECPLQNLTMRHGPGVSRFNVDEKYHLAKHVPLGDLIFLDRERCIQCARCTRFQDEIADDAVIGFEGRGRALQIASYSKPGFDSYFSGNTTDICPVGALTSADFRFGARPWELQHSASICPHCPVGCNLHLNTRRSGVSGERVIKRVMPRQNEWVNEIWICDKGRFGHHFATSPDRLTTPLVRRDGELAQASWDEALDVVADKIRTAGGAFAALAGERLSNEDLFNFRKLVEGAGGRVAQWPGQMGGGDLVQQVGVGVGTDIASVGAGTVIVVVACDLVEEAPVWWMRVKQAATKSGASPDKSRATLVVANARPTKLDRYAAHSLRYAYGDEVRTVLGLAHAAAGEEAGVEANIAASADGDLGEAGKAIAEADNLIVFYGREGLDFAGSTALAQACANLLIATGHVGRANNGLIPVWPHNNTQGAWDMGVRPSGQPLAEFLADAQVVLAAGADPVGDGEALPDGAFVVAVELFSTATAQGADVVLPAQSFVEREGTFTNGERRVQRFYPALAPKGQSRPDWQILGQLAERLDLDKCAPSAAAVFLRIAREVPQYAALTYRKLAEVVSQYPDVGGRDLYYGGTAFHNTAGLGAQYPAAAEQGEEVTLTNVQPSAPASGELLAIPITLLYDRGTTFVRSFLMHPRLPEPYVELNASDAAKLGLADGDVAVVAADGAEMRAVARVNGRAPAGSVLVPQSRGGLVLNGAVPAALRKAE